MAKKRTDKDLISELAVDTENVNLPPLGDNGNGNGDFEPDTPTPNEDDFEPVPQAENDTDGDYSERPQAKPLTRDKIASMAKRWIRGLDYLQRWIFKPVYKKSILEKDDIQKVKEFRKRNYALSEKEMDRALHEDESMSGVSDRMDRFIKAVENLPFTDEEQELISDDLAELIEKYAFLRLTPEWSLVIGLGIVMVSRLEPVVPSDMFNSK